MEEKNELNDIILNKGGSSSGSKKLLLAIATLTLVLIIVLVIMNSLKQDEVQKAPQAILPPEPTAPTEIINDPLFEPVEVIQEGAAPAQGKDLNEVAQKLKEQSLQNSPTAAPAPTGTQTPAPASTPAAAPAPVKTTAPAVQSAAPAPQQPKATTLTAAPAQKAPAKAATTPAPAPAAAAPEPKKATIVKTSKPAVITSKPVTEKAAPVKKAEPKVDPKTEVRADTKADAKTEPKPESKTPAAAAAPVNTGATYYIQVGSFSQEPNKALFDRLNSSGMKYTTQKSGSVTKILVGPFQGEKSVNDAMGTVRQNIEPKAFRIKG